MAVVKHSTTAAFGIEASPLQIGASTFVAENMTFSRVGNRVDIADDTGTVTGVAVVSAITEGSCTVQLATETTPIPTVGATFALSGTRNDGTYVITNSETADSQGEFAKVSLSFFASLS